MTAIAILLLASLPFALKGVTLWFGFTGYLAQSAYKILQLLIPLVWRFGRGERGFSVAWPVRDGYPFLRLLNLGVLLALIIAGIAIAGIVYVGPAWGLEPRVIRAAYDQRFDVSGVAAIAVVLFLSFVNSALEELYFRVWLDRELTKRIGHILGISISAFAFGAMHGFILFGLPGIPLECIIAMVLGLTLAGICWSLLIRRPGGVYAAWLSHGLTDALLLTWGLFWLGYL